VSVDVTIWLIVLTIALVTLYPLIKGKRRTRPARGLLAFETQRDLRCVTASPQFFCS
jgi:hypothetical protein